MSTITRPSRLALAETVRLAALLFTAATLLATLLRTRNVALRNRLRAPLPGALDHFGLRFAVRAVDR